MKIHTHLPHISRWNSRMILQPAILVLIFMLPMFGTAQVEKTKTNNETEVQAAEEEEIRSTVTHEGVTRRVEIEQENLPAAVQGSINNKYPMAVFIRAFKYLDEEAAIYFYEVHLDRQNQPDLELTYNAEGEELRAGNVEPEREEEENQKKSTKKRGR